MASDNQEASADAQHLPGSDRALQGEVVPGGVLEQELWRRRHDRREQAVALGLDAGDAALAPLVLSLARLAAHRHISRPSRREATGRE